MADPVQDRYRFPDASPPPHMIGLSVAVGRFVEALFWAILRVAGSLAAVVFAGAIALVALLLLARRAWRKRAR